jgi:hypothetical protein
LVFLGGEGAADHGPSGLEEQRFANRRSRARRRVRVEMTVMSKDHEAQLRNLIVGYGDSIRLSDIKANIAVLFVAIMMGTVLQFRDHYPRYLNVPVLLAPFIVIFFNLLASVYPRFPRAGRKRFPIWRHSDPEEFEFIADPVLDVEELPVRCALLSRILFWKNITLQTAYLVSIGTLVVAGVLLFVNW